MITIIFGAPGVGKTALNTYFALQHLDRKQAWEDVKSSQAIVQRLNNGGYNFTLPVKHLVYSDYPITYKAYDCAPRESFLVNGFRLGLPNEQHEVSLLPPGAFIHLSEGQRYFNSRMSTSLSDFVSRFYEMHRHYGLTIYIDVQRSQLIDINIREVAARFIEVQSMKHKFDRNGFVKRSEWITREFDSSYELDKYFEDGKPASIGKNVKYVFKGNIFDYYNSENCFPAFLARTDETTDFSYMPQHYTGYNINDINYYNEHLGSAVPETYYKERKR